MKAKPFAFLAGMALIATLGITSHPAQARERSAPNGSRLWAQTCIRCHNLRPPSQFSEMQWEVIMVHMRIRANLTAEEHKAIYEFIRSSR